MPLFIRSLNAASHGASHQAKLNHTLDKGSIYVMGLSSNLPKKVNLIIWGFVLNLSIFTCPATSNQDADASRTSTDKPAWRAELQRLKYHQALHKSYFSSKIKHVRTQRQKIAFACNKYTQARPPFHIYHIE